MSITIPVFFIFFPSVKLYCVALSVSLTAIQIPIEQSYVFSRKNVKKLATLEKQSSFEKTRMYRNLQSASPAPDLPASAGYCSFCPLMLINQGNRILTWTAGDIHHPSVLRKKGENPYYRYGWQYARWSACLLLHEPPRFTRFKLFSKKSKPDGL